MYPTSSQRKYWTYQNEREIGELRLKHNQNFVLHHGNVMNIDVSFLFDFQISKMLLFIKHGSFYLGKSSLSVFPNT